MWACGPYMLKVTRSHGRFAFDCTSRLRKFPGSVGNFDCDVDHGREDDETLDSRTWRSPLWDVDYIRFIRVKVRRTQQRG